MPASCTARCSRSSRPTAPNPTELFQIWLNLPAADKMVEPYFTMLWATDIPVVAFEGGSVTIVAGALGDAKPASPPPNSWAARDDAEVAIWVLRLDAGASWTMPATHHPDVVRTVYFFEGDSLSIGDHQLGASTGAVVAQRRRRRGARRRHAPSNASCCRAGRSASRLRSTDRSS